MAFHTMHQATGYAWIYEAMVTSAKTWGNILSVLSGILAGVVGTEGVIELSTNASECEGPVPEWVRIMTAVCSFLIVVVIVVGNTWKLDVVKSEGLAAQVSFAHLGRSISYQLALTHAQRQEGQDFVKGVLTEIDQLKLTSPTIDRAAKALYIRKFPDNPIYSNNAAPWIRYGAGPGVVANTSRLAGPLLALPPTQPRLSNSTVSLSGPPRQQHFSAPAHFEIEMAAAHAPHAPAGRRDGDGHRAPAPGGAGHRRQLSDPGRAADSPRQPELRSPGTAPTTPEHKTSRGLFAPSSPTAHSLPWEDRPSLSDSLAPAGDSPESAGRSSRDRGGSECSGRGGGNSEGSGGGGWGGEGSGGGGSRHRRGPRRLRTRPDPSLGYLAPHRSPDRGDQLYRRKNSIAEMIDTFEADYSVRNPRGSGGRPTPARRP